MPPRESRARQITALKRRKSVSNQRDFDTLIKKCPDRYRLISEGDSWFAYPRKILSGKPGNIIDHIESKTKGLANLLRLESNGDEITEMMSSGQRHKLTRLLARYHDNGTPVDVLFFSGGGNDIVGEWDMERFIVDHQTGFTAEQCINRTALSIKLAQIDLAFRELINIRDQYSPGTTIITHTFDVPFVTGKPAKYLGLKIGPWLTPALVKRGVPKRLFRPIIRIVLTEMARTIAQIQTDMGAAGKFQVARTLGTLTTEGQWLNEIHPTSAGFGLVADKVYARLKVALPNLPD